MPLVAPHARTRSAADCDKVRAAVKKCIELEGAIDTSAKRDGHRKPKSTGKIQKKQKVNRDILAHYEAVDLIEDRISQITNEIEATEVLAAYIGDSSDDEVDSDKESDCEMEELCTEGESDDDTAVDSDSDTSDSAEA